MFHTIYIHVEQYWDVTGKFRRGVSITRESLAVFRDNPRLTLLPFLSFLAVGSAFAVVGGAVFYYGLVDNVFGNKLIQYAAMFVILAVSSSAGTFFNAAVVHCVSRYFEGRETSVRDGLAAAWRVRRTIALWAVTAATLGTVLYIIDDTFGGLGSLGRALFDLAWALLTFFVIPVIILEDTSSIRSVLRESGAAFKETWGESVTASVGVSVAFFPVGLVGFAGLGYAYFLLDGLSALFVGSIGGVILIASMVSAQIVGMIVRTALYRYATDDQCVGPFEGYRNPQYVFPSE